MFAGTEKNISLILELIDRSGKSAMKDEPVEKYGNDVVIREYTPRITYSTQREPLDEKEKISLRRHETVDSNSSHHWRKNVRAARHYKDPVETRRVLIYKDLSKTIMVSENDVDSVQIEGRSQEISYNQQLELERELEMQGVSDIGIALVLADNTCYHKALEAMKKNSYLSLDDAIKFASGRLSETEVEVITEIKINETVLLNMEEDTDEEDSVGSGFPREMGNFLSPIKGGVKKIPFCILSKKDKELLLGSLDEDLYVQSLLYGRDGNLRPNTPNIDDDSYEHLISHEREL